MNIKWQDYIEEHKEVMMGKPGFKGTRLTVEHVLNELGTGGIYQVSRLTTSPHPPFAKGGLHGGHCMPKEVS